MNIFKVNRIPGIFFTADWKRLQINVSKWAPKAAGKVAIHEAEDYFALAMKSTDGSTAELLVTVGRVPCEDLQVERKLCQTVNSDTEVTLVC